jgi:hypothetical protein
VIALENRVTEVLLNLIVQIILIIAIVIDLQGAATNHTIIHVKRIVKAAEIVAVMIVV